MKHEQLWAPWRLEYITRERDIAAAREAPELLPGADENCFICRAAADTADRENLVVQRGEHTLTILNRFPYNNGHLLVATKRHWARLDEPAAEVHLEAIQTMTRLVGLLERSIRAEGFNIGLNLGRAAGAGLPGHLHWHVVPRWSGDTNFMPVLGGVDVIPQSLEALWEVLADALSHPP